MPASSPLTPRAAVRSRSSHKPAPRTRLWLEFINTDAAPLIPRGDLLRDFNALVRWLVEMGVVDQERAAGLDRRALLQPAAATATLVDARRVRAALRGLAERSLVNVRVRDDAIAEVNRVLGRSTGTRRVEIRDDGSVVRVFVPTGDAFAGLMIPIVESAADSLVINELPRIRRCIDARCTRVFLDTSRNGTRRWCDMGTCGNRAKAARHRARARVGAADAPDPEQR